MICQKTFAGCSSGRYFPIKILCILAFLSCAFICATGHPYRQQSDSEDEVDKFRSFVVGRLPIADDLEEFKADYETDDLDFDEGEGNGDLDYHSFTKNKRTPNSATYASYQNNAGYYLIEGPNHTVFGTPDMSTCNRRGVFQFGKTNGVPFVKNVASGWYLAISDNGRVYMTPTKSSDTKVRHLVTSTLKAFIYRITSNKTRFFLDISPQSSTVPQARLSDTSTFRIQMSKTC